MCIRDRLNILTLSCPINYWNNKTPYSINIILFKYYNGGYFEVVLDDNNNALGTDGRWRCLVCLGGSAQTKQTSCTDPASHAAMARRHFHLVFFFLFHSSLTYDKTCWGNTRPSRLFLHPWASVPRSLQTWCCLWSFSVECRKLL